MNFLEFQIIKKIYVFCILNDYNVELKVDSLHDFFEFCDYLNKNESFILKQFKSSADCCMLKQHSTLQFKKNQI